MNEITPALIYWITRLDPLNKAGGAMAILGFGLGLFLFAPICDPDLGIGDGAIAKLKRAQKWLLTIGIVGILICTFMPTKKEAAAMIVIPRIANSETVSEIGDGVKTLAVEWLEELRPKKNKEK